jgi:sulfotransferase family protein
VPSSYSATAGLPFDDAQLESNLVWIFGSPRSGSTWLAEMLCHPLRMDPQRELGFRWGPRWQGQARALPVNEFGIGSHLAPRMPEDPDPTIEEDGGELLPRTLPRANRDFSSYAFSAPYADVWRPEARRLTLVRLQAVVDRARAAGLNLPPDGPLLVIKEVNGSHAADLVMSLFPRSRLIFLVRDGRDVVDSLVDASRPGGWIEQLESRRPSFETPDERRAFVRRNALLWRARMTACARAYAGLAPEHRFKLRYEDLLADTHRKLADLARWLGLPAGPKWIATVAEEHDFTNIPEGGRGPGKITRAATPGAWRQGLEPDERETANEVMGPALAELGYTVDAESGS